MRHLIIIYRFTEQVATIISTCVQTGKTTAQPEVPLVPGMLRWFIHCALWCGDEVTLYSK